LRPYLIATQKLAAKAVFGHMSLNFFCFSGFVPPKVWF
jgi:hypothetical protein